MFELICDTGANLPPELAAARGIRVISLHLIVNGEEKRAEDCPELYPALRRGEKVSTSLVSEGQWLDALREAGARSGEVLCVTMSSGISGTCRAAELAAAELREEHPAWTVEIVDSLNTSLGEGRIVLFAADLRDEGLSAAEAAERLRQRRAEEITLFTVPDLKYLQRTGRLSGSAALIGGALNIRPVLTNSPDGQCVVSARAHGGRKALELMADRWKNQCPDPGEDVALTDADNPADAERLLGLLRDRGFTGNCLREPLECVSGVHLGPDTVGLFYRGRR